MFSPTFYRFPLSDFENGNSSMFATFKPQNTITTRQGRFAASRDPYVFLRVYPITPVGGVAEGAQAPAQTELRVYPITPVGGVAEGAQAPAKTELRVYPTAHRHLIDFNLLQAIPFASQWDALDSSLLSSTNEPLGRILVSGQYPLQQIYLFKKHDPKRQPNHHFGTHPWGVLYFDIFPKLQGILWSLNLSSDATIENGANGRK
jgi:hypothetical protein